MGSTKRPRPAFAAPFALAVRRPLRVCGARVSTPSMSGVNGGIDYDIDLGTLPPTLARRVRYIQSGPDSPTELIAAARDLAEAAPSSPAMLPVLVDVLGFNNPVAAGLAVDALANAGQDAVPVLLVGVGAFNYAVNAYALRALGRIGDPTVLPVVAACARQGPIPGVRRAACAALAALRFTDGAAAAEAFECLARLADGERDWGVRYAAVVGIERFVARELLDEQMRDLGVRVLHGILQGERCFIEEEGEGQDKQTGVEIENDPTVVARATVALETLAALSMPVG